MLEQIRARGCSKENSKNTFVCIRWSQTTLSYLPVTFIGENITWYIRGLEYHCQSDPANLMLNNESEDRPLLLSLFGHQAPATYYDPMAVAHQAKSIQAAYDPYHPPTLSHTTAPQKLPMKLSICPSLHDSHPAAPAVLPAPVTNDRENKAQCATKATKHKSCAVGEGRTSSGLTKGIKILDPKNLDYNIKIVYFFGLNSSPGLSLAMASFTSSIAPAATLPCVTRCSRDRSSRVTTWPHLRNWDPSVESSWRGVRWVSGKPRYRFD